MIGLLGAFAISFYFSANTIIYYLMRREVDATELDDVYVEQSEDEFGDARGTRPGGAATGRPPADRDRRRPPRAVEPAAIDNAKRGDRTVSAFAL